MKIRIKINFKKINKTYKNKLINWYITDFLNNKKIIDEILADQMSRLRFLSIKSIFLFQFCLIIQSTFKIH